MTTNLWSKTVFVSYLQTGIILGNAVVTDKVKFNCSRNNKIKVLVVNTLGVVSQPHSVFGSYFRVSERVSTSHVRFKISNVDT